MYNESITYEELCEIVENEEGLAVTSRSGIVNITDCNPFFASF